ncbi:mRNAion factor HES-7-like [Huso huso]|uniref:mRNAion factor HES-7-like n=1 Tax=Huso huso TaxID=61971 RepID=A0ABR0Y1F0_HUSHU
MKNCNETGFKSMKRMLKPLVEKKRRDRINQSLDQLQALLLHSTRDERFQNPKLEKAELLELTVQYLERRSLTKHKHNEIQKQEAEPPNLRQNYEDGFRECFSQLTNFMKTAGLQAQIHLMDRFQHHGAFQTSTPHLEDYFPSTPPNSTRFAQPDPHSQHHDACLRQSAIGLALTRSPEGSPPPLPGRCYSSPSPGGSSHSHGSFHSSTPGSKSLNYDWSASGSGSPCDFDFSPNQKMTRLAESPVRFAPTQKVWRPWP